MEIIFVELKLIIVEQKSMGYTNGGLVLSGKIIHVLVQGGFLKWK
jgi:hypothetical protein